MNRIAIENPQLSRLTDAIAQRVGPQRFAVWFSNSAKFDLRNDSLEINVPNDFISDWIGTHFAMSIQEATHEVFGSALPVKFNIVPQLFEARAGEVASASGSANGSGASTRNSRQVAMTPTRRTPALGSVDVSGFNPAVLAGSTPHTQRPSKPILHDSRPGSNHTSSYSPQPSGPIFGEPQTAAYAKGRLRHGLETYVVGSSNQLAHSTANYVCEFPGGQYNPLFIHGTCGLGKTHLLQGLCRKFAEMHPTKKWMYLTGEEFTNEYVHPPAQTNKVDAVPPQDARPRPAGDR